MHLRLFLTYGLLSLKEILFSFFRGGADLPTPFEEEANIQSLSLQLISFSKLMEHCQTFDREDIFIGRSFSKKLRGKKMVPAKCSNQLARDTEQPLLNQNKNRSYIQDAVYNAFPHRENWHLPWRWGETIAGCWLRLRIHTRPPRRAPGVFVTLHTNNPCCSVVYVDSR